jgi:hypothetical protein
MEILMTKKDLSVQDGEFTKEIAIHVFVVPLRLGLHGGADRVLLPIRSLLS